MLSNFELVTRIKARKFMALVILVAKLLFSVVLRKYFAAIKQVASVLDRWGDWLLDLVKVGCVEKLGAAWEGILSRNHQFLVLY